MSLAAQQPQRDAQRLRAKDAVAVAAQDQALFEALRAWRSGEAKRQHVPPYVIFSDRTLAEIALMKPGSNAALSVISGVGETKLERYGAAVIGVVGSQALAA